MNKIVVASVLLSSMALAFPAYAEGDRTPDEYNPDAKFESPLDRSFNPIVNDHPNGGRASDSQIFAEEAVRLVQGAASGKPVTNAVAVEKAEWQATEVLSKTDEDFEPAQDQEYKGYEYQSVRMGQPLESKGFIPDTEAVKTADSQAADTGANTKQAAGKETVTMPLVITGDDAQYANETGDFIIEGNVSVRQGATTLRSAKAVGNAKTGDIWLLQGGTLKESSNTVNAQWAHYNFNKKTGEMKNIRGEALPDPSGKKKDFFNAPHGVIENGQMVIDQGGNYTRCPAVLHPSCVSVHADKIVIVPNRQIVAYKVKVFLRGKHIYSRDVWKQEIGEGANKEVLMPRFGWKSSKGYYISLDYEQPIGNPLLKNPTKIYTQQVYYTKSRYKPFWGIRHDEHDFYVRLHDGYVYDSDNDEIDEGIWLHKKADWGLFLKPHRIARGIPLTYDANITHGLWKYSNESWSSWHTEKVVHLRHDRIYPFKAKKLYVDLMAGHKWVNESHAGTPDTVRHGKKLHTNIFSGTVGYRFSDKWNIWQSYQSEHKTSYNFSLGQPDFSREWITGITWKPDDRNSFSVVNRYNADQDSDTHGFYSTKYIWKHRFCCEVLSVEYKRKHYNHDDSWSVKLDFANW